MSVITYRPDGSAASFVGREAVNVFALVQLKVGLALELRCPGMRLSSRFSTLKVAKQTTGLRTNNRQRHIDRLEEMIKEAKAKCGHLTQGAASPGGEK